MKGSDSIAVLAPQLSDGHVINLSPLRDLILFLRGRPSLTPDAITAPPPETGDERLDATLAAVAEKIADDAKIERPAWTARVPGCVEKWDLGSRSLASKPAPSQFAARNLWIEEDVLWGDSEDALPQSPFQVGLRVGEKVTGTVTDRGTVLLPDGQEIDMSHTDAQSSPLVRGAVLRRVLARSFDRCPICLEQGPRESEHVPPRSIGGKPMTHTCKRCNNEFGVIESALARYMRREAGVGFRSESVDGTRRAKRVFTNRTASGGFFLLLDGKNMDQAIDDMFKDGEVEMEITTPQEPWLRTALLKHSYLAACMVLGTIPDTPLAREVRAELIAARDDRRALQAGAGHHAQSLLSFRSDEGEAAADPVMLTAINQNGSWVLGFNLGTFGFVSWPIGDLRIEVQEPIRSD